MITTTPQHPIAKLCKMLAVVGFEPTPPWRLVPKTSALDHSATLPILVKRGKKCIIIIILVEKNYWRCGESNPGPFTCEANALPLSYIPVPISKRIFSDVSSHNFVYRPIIPSSFITWPVSSVG